MLHAEPTVDTSDRLSLIRWLEWNDPNGCYADAECVEEGMEPLTTDQLRALYADQHP